MTVEPEEKDPAECIGAAVVAAGAGFVVRLDRADGGSMEIACESAARAAELLRAMTPPNLLAALAALDAAQRPPTLH